MPKFYTLQPEKYECVVIISTFNGAQFLSKQLDSLNEQSFSNFQILVRDDGSVDSTLEILHEYKETLNLILIEDTEHLGLFRSYSLLLKLAQNFRFIALCDQDDIWHPNKLRITIELLKGDTAALLVHNFDILEGERITSSKIRRDLASQTQAYIYIRNIYPGHSYVFKSYILNDFNYELDVPHDWQLLVNAAKNRQIIFLEDVLLTYRIHPNNTIGLGNKNPWKTFSRMSRVFLWRSLILGQTQPTLKKMMKNFLKLIRLVIVEKELNLSAKILLITRLSLQLLAYLIDAALNK